MRIPTVRWPQNVQLPYQLNNTKTAIGWSSVQTFAMAKKVVTEANSYVFFGEFIGNAIHYCEEG